MALKTNNVREIKQVPWGCWLWRMPDGSFVADDQNNFLRLFGTEHDESRKQLMRDYVRANFGITEGAPFFMSGVRPVTDEEYEHQKQRLEWGLTPDPLDVASIEEDKKNAHRRQ
jgi:hypothetical protein